MGGAGDVTNERARKEAVRERVWRALDVSGAAPDAHGRIPTFDGNDHAADRLTALIAWRRARTVKANPDRAQQPVRAHALRDRKLVFMAVPRLADVNPFYRLDPEVLGADAERAADRHVAAGLAQTVAVDALPSIDLIVCGSVAVNTAGVRIGKGAGYSDIEVALLAEAGLLTSETTIVTTVHELQVIDEEFPRQGHDFTVDFIATPERVIECGAAHRPRGVEWGSVTSAMMHDIPVLRTMREKQNPLRR